MAGINYSGIDTHSGLGLDNPSTSLISDVFDNLQARQSVSYADLGESTEILQSRLGNPAYSEKARIILQAFYDLTTDPGGQAHVLGPLLVPENLDIVRNLLALPDNPLASRLGPQGVDTLIQTAGSSNPLARLTKLFQFAQSNLRVAQAPAQYSNDTDLENRTQNTGEDIGGWLNANLARAIASGNVQTCEQALAAIPDASLPYAARSAANLGGNARNILNQLLQSPNPRASQFAFSALEHIGASSIVDGETQTGSASLAQDHPTSINTSALERLIMSPDSTPASLARRFAGVAGVNAHVLEIIVR